MPTNSLRGPSRGSWQKSSPALAREDGRVVQARRDIIERSLDDRFDRKTKPPCRHSML